MADLIPGITRTGTGQDEVVWNILGHRYFLKADCENAFCFETYDPPGTFVPPHIHPTQDEFIWVLEGRFDLHLGRDQVQAHPGDLVRMPRGLPMLTTTTAIRRRGPSSGSARRGACVRCSTSCTTSKTWTRWSDFHASAR